MEVNILAVNARNNDFRNNIIQRKQHNLDITKILASKRPTIFILTEVSQKCTVKEFDLPEYKVFGLPATGIKTLGSIVGVLDDSLSFKDSSKDWFIHRGAQVDLVLKNDYRLSILGIYPASFGKNFCPEIFTRMIEWIDLQVEGKRNFIVAGDINCDTDSENVNFSDYDFTRLKTLANQYDVWLNEKAIKKGVSTTNPFKKSRVDRIFTNLTVDFVEHSREEFKNLSDHAMIFARLKFENKDNN